MSSLTWLVVVLPLAAFAFNFLFLRKNKSLAPLVAIAGVGASFVLALALAWSVLQNPAPRVQEWTWLNVGFGTVSLRIGVGTLLDPLCAMMLVVVTLISLLVHVYSLGYMGHDKGIVRFFLYLSMFTFSMLGLVVSPNFYQMYFFWELVGLCSYLLIGFWYFKPEAADASKKAFVVNRVGDFGFFLGILLLTYYPGTSDFLSLPAKVAQWPLLGPAWLPLGVVALLVFAGAVGKSAQFPLHVWLPDAMEGPTPVSALIHAATMVAAGVYMVARAYFVFDLSTLSSVNALQVVAWVGGFTCLFAALIACTQFDVKRVLAYSTLSQLGYMIMALGMGGLGFTAGPFHLFTHAFFKALLFLGAGSLIHAMDTNDMRAMGGLWRKMPITGWTFLVACLAISGIFPFAGFWSKDMIFAAAAATGHTALLVLGVGVAFLTAFYMFRAFFMTFTGSEPAQAHPHESPANMTIPLIVLAVLSAVAGFAGAPFVRNGFGHYIRYQRDPALTQEWNQSAQLAAANPQAVGTAAALPLLASAPALPAAPVPAEEKPDSMNMTLTAISTVVALSGLLLAMLMYYWKRLSAEAVSRAFGPLYTATYHKFYVDELYGWLVDHVYFTLAACILWFDRNVVDGVLNFLAWASHKGGAVVRRAQTGQVQAYLLVFFSALAVLILAVHFCYPALCPGLGR